MIPVGYMAKRVQKKPQWLMAPNVIDIYSVSNCISKDFADYIPFWRHNGYWFFDSPQIIRLLAAEKSIDIKGATLFYHEAFEMQFDGEHWNRWFPEPTFKTDVVLPVRTQLEGFDVVNFTAGTSPECCGLSCTTLASELETNVHCLFSAFDEAKERVEEGAFTSSEPGPYRIFGVHTIISPSGDETQFSL